MIATSCTGDIIAYPLGHRQCNCQSICFWKALVCNGCSRLLLVHEKLVFVYIIVQPLCHTNFLP